MLDVDLPEDAPLENGTWGQHGTVRSWLLACVHFDMLFTDFLISREEAFSD